jgi:polyadenylate-binding protein
MDGGSFHSASLYVGDLAPEVNEGLMFEIFNAVGPVASIRVCRDTVTRRSLGYAYVNFHQLADAERALDTMNYTMIKGRPCRIMWSQRDPSLRRSNVGNIFVKNLHTSIDHKQLYDTFSLFGNILSCKVVTDPKTGESKGYGYVHYETGEAATAAIEKLDGMLIDGQEVKVGHFMRVQDRPGGMKDWTNCYVKNIPQDWDNDRLNKEFAAFGEIISAAIAETEENDNKDASGDNDEKKENDDGVSKHLGYGFVNFSNHEDAVAAVESLNGRKFPSGKDEEETELVVCRAQKKAERERELRAKYEAAKMERIQKFQGTNLYIKNLDENVTDDMLREEFSAMGTITSARIMRDLKDSERSRGFGFVCFSSPEEASRAVNEMNGKLILSKPIFVALAQRKDVRRAQLEAQHASRAAAGGMGGPMMRPGGMGGPMGYPPAGSGPMYMQPQRPGMQPAYPMMAGRGMPMMPQGAGGRGPYPMPMYGVMPQQPGRGGCGGRGGRGRGPNGPPNAGGNNIKFNQQARNAAMPQQPPAGPGMQPVPMTQQPAASAGEPAALTAAALAAASPEMQKNMIGERLYPLIHSTQPELAGKITGMLLEMDNSELLHLLESPDALAAKIKEALAVLEAHNASS